MRWLASLLALCGLTMPLAAQVLPTPGFDNPRLQTVRYAAGQEVMLTALPQTGLTVVLDPAEEITRIVAGNAQSFDVRVSAERNSFQITPRAAARETALTVETSQRRYEFAVQVGEGLLAAYLVRFEYGPASLPPVPDAVLGLEPSGSSETWRYRLRGARQVRPLEVSDDGAKTRIRYAEDQALPAVFAIGPTGDEEVVNGYMREGVFVIDRVYSELVFRIDRKEAAARRRDDPETGS